MRARARVRGARARRGRKLAAQLLGEQGEPQQQEQEQLGAVFVFPGGANVSHKT